jgi:hypothetical protein
MNELEISDALVPIGSLSIKCVITLDCQHTIEIFTRPHGGLCVVRPGLDKKTQVKVIPEP